MHSFAFPVLALALQVWLQALAPSPTDIATSREAPTSERVERATTITTSAFFVVEAPWSGHSAVEWHRVHGPLEKVDFGSARRSPRDASELEEAAGQVSRVLTDRPKTLPDLSTAVHPDRIHGPPDSF